MSCSPQTMYTTLEATLRRRNSLSPTGTKATLHLNLIDFVRFIPLCIFFFPALFLYEILLLLAVPQRGGEYIKPVLRNTHSSLISL